MSRGVKPQKRADLISREVEDETVVWDPRCQRVHYLNRTASYIWRRCDGRYSGKEIAHQMARAFARDPATVEPDAQAVLERFEASGLLGPPPDDSGESSGYRAAQALRRSPPPLPTPSRTSPAEADPAPPHRLTMTALGCGICVELPTPDLLELFEAAYGALQCRPDSLELSYSVNETAGSGYALSRNGSEVGTIANRSELIWLFDGDFCVELQRLRSQLYFLHAAVLGLEGRGFVFAGGIGAGKSTLSWALSHCGFDYLSDEMAPVDLEALAVHPFPRSIALKEDSPAPYPVPPTAVRTSRTLHIPESSLPSPIAHRAHALTNLFLVDNDPAASTPTLQQITPAKAATHVFTHALNALAHPADGLDGAIRIVTGADCFQLVSADLAATCRLVRSVC